MPDPCDAEIQAGADAIARSWRVLSPTSRRHLAKLVLSAVLPGHDARVRADERARVAEEIARDIESVETAHDWGRGDGLSQAASRWRHDCGHTQTFEPSRDPRTPGSGPQAGCRCDGCGHPTSLYEWEHVDRGAACPATWVDDWGKDHACDKGADHTGGHECGCGARVPAHLLSVATRLARAVAVVAHRDRPSGVNESAALRTLAMDALRAGLIDAETAEGSDPPTSGE